ncbi:MAG TPA: hypothetical protein VKI65_19450 [Gemmataceae bacterium]|nr:hypothetical protein [Gemmataceae bacterium]
MRIAIAVMVTLAVLTAAVRAEQPRATPLPVPLTRLEVKQYLEDLKTRRLRIPLPELTEAEKGKLGRVSQSI